MRFPGSGVLRDQKGLALPSVLIFAVVFVILLGAVFTLVSSNYVAATTNRNRVAALMAAEAGINEAIARFNTLMKGPNGTVPEASFTGAIGDASYSVSIIDTGNNTGVIRAVGRKGQVTRRVEVGVSLVPAAWRHVVYAEVKPDDKTVSKCDPQSGPYGPSFGEIPEPDWDKYKAIATRVLTPEKEHGKKSGWVRLQNETLEGIIYVDGNLEIKNKVTIKGCLIVDGQIDINGGHLEIEGFPSPYQLDIDGDGQLESVTLPTMITKETVWIRGGSHLKVEGLVYALQSIDISGGLEVDGSLVGREIGAKGGSKISIWIDYDETDNVPPHNFADDLTNAPPPFFSGGARDVVFRKGTWSSGV